MQSVSSESHSSFANVIKCPSCQYKIESDRMHAVIDALLNDLKSQNLENVSSSVYDLETRDDSTKLVHVLTDI
ncbi:hypothetical protein GCM10008014_29210 [Paenibacillus silvae]|uniref:Uncharacterized protein n=1 Tax=Paenibacillus silvae TaxID=1325358 RepID=A0ABQ1ZCF1_9BACL|nr:hypothetical protein GCM10008014_29210 [Paenibacillus silvae]